MKTRKVKEPEILDALLGGEDDALAARVRQAVRQDMTSATQYAEWSRVLPVLRQDLAPVARLGRDARAKVMDRLREEKMVHEAGWMPPEDARLVAAINASKPRVISLARPRRWRRWASAAGICAAGMIGLFITGLWVLALSGPATVVNVTGQVLAISLAHAAEPRSLDEKLQPGGLALNDDKRGASLRSSGVPLASGARLRLPFRIEAAAGGHAEVRLPDGSLMTVSGGATLTVESSRRVSQMNGPVAYRTEHALLRENFTVLIPQGRVEDLGTEFKVEVVETGQSVVDVREGRVRVQPSRGLAVEARAGDQAILSPMAAVVLPPPDLGRNDRTSDTLGKKVEAEAPLRVEFRPALAALATGGPLAGLPQPRSIPLATAAPPALVRRVPPFTSPQPLFGVLRMRLDGRAIEAALACDKKVSGRWRIYLDANLDGDLTNDTNFNEGEDFIADRYFEAGLLDHNNALWLRRPLGAGDPGGEPDHLEFVNRLYASGPVQLPTSSGTPAQSVWLNLIDTDGDGDLFDPQGALAVWTAKGQAGSTDPILALANAGAPSVLAGCQWVLARRADGAFELTGRTLASLRKRTLRVGGPLPSLDVQAIDGRRIQLPPRGRWLLIYVWTTWLGSGQRDAPFSIEGLYPKFRERGLSMVGVCVDYRKDDLLNYLKTSNTGYPQVFSGPEVWSGVAGDLGVDQVPATILVDPQGRIVALGKSGEEIWSLLDASLPAAKK